jgi:predicted ArsR family transcriptional regulator
VWWSTSPPRRYEIAGEVLAGALELLQHPASTATPAGEAVAQAAGQAGRQAAGQAGRQIAAGGTDLAEVLSRSGYEPKHGPGQSVYLANCPFHELAGRHASLVCMMNLHLLRGLIDGLGSRAQARLDPAEGRCCVAIDLPRASPAPRPGQ